MKSPHHSVRFILPTAALLIGFAACLAASPAIADTAFWNGGQGNWNDPARWTVDSDTPIPGRGGKFWAVTIADPNGEAKVLLDPTPMAPQIHALAISEGDSLEIRPDATLLMRTDLEELGGNVINNSGTLMVRDGGNLIVQGKPNAEPGDGIVTLSGGGQLVLNGQPGPASGANIRGQGGNPKVLINDDNVISGSGRLGQGSLVLVNRKQIVANRSMERLVIHPGGGSNFFPGEFTNDELAKLSSRGGGILELHVGKFNFAATSSIEAGDNSFVDIVNSTVQGGLLRAIGSGRFRGAGNVRFTGPTGNPVTIDAQTPVDLHNGFDHVLEGEIVNSGLISLQAGDRTTRLFIDGEASLSGEGGVIRLSSQLPTNPARLAPRGADAVLLVGRTQRVDGAGSIERGLTLNNQGTIAANMKDRTLMISPTGGHRIVNDGGTLAAEEGGTLHLLRSWELTSPALGFLQASDQSVVLIDGVRLTNQQLQTPDNDTLDATANEIDAEQGVIRIHGTGSVFDIRESPIFNQGLVEIPSNASLVLRGDPVESLNLPQRLVNNGAIRLNADPSGAAAINVNLGDVRLTGGGRIVMADRGGANVITQSAVDQRTNTLWNEDNLIEGAGNLGETRLRIVNGPAGVFRANVDGELVVAPAVNHESGAENIGVWEAVEGGRFAVRGGQFVNRLDGTIRSEGEGSLFLVDGASGFLSGGSTTLATSEGTLRFTDSEIALRSAVTAEAGGALEIHDSTVEFRRGPNFTARLAAAGENTRIDLSGGSVLRGSQSPILTAGSGAFIRNLDQATIVQGVLGADFIGVDGSNTILQSSIAGGNPQFVDLGRIFVSGFSNVTRVTIAQTDETNDEPFRMRENLEIILTGSQFNQVTGKEATSRLQMEGGVIRGGGTVGGLQLEVGNAAQIIADGRVPSPGSAGHEDLEIAGRLTINTNNEADSLTNAGRLAAVEGGTLTIEDSLLANLPSGRVSIHSNSKFAAHNVNNSGLFEVMAGGEANLDGSLQQIEAGVARTVIAGNLTARRADIDFGFILIDGEVTIREGDEAFTVAREASLGGRGTINGKLATSGIFNPGDSPGIFTVNGDFEQLPGGVLEIEIAGTQAGSEYDQVSVNGAATLNGTLDVSLLDVSRLDHGDGLLRPQAGDAFTILTANQGVAGAFESAYVPPLPRPLRWKLEYLPNAVQLRVAVPETTCGSLLWGFATACCAIRPTRW